MIPISLAILVGLFAVQRYGTGAVGWMFGPVILVWFGIIAALGWSRSRSTPASSRVSRRRGRRGSWSTTASTGG